MERTTASEWLMPRCTSRPSVMSRSMLSTGFRLVTGSWKIIEMSRPRMARTSDSGSVSRSRPMNSMLPLTVAFGTMPVRPMMALAVTLLPQPLSPTSPTSSPGATSKRHAVDGVDRAFL